jgi:hypothetical protein
MKFILEAEPESLLVSLHLMPSGSVRLSVQQYTNGSSYALLDLRSDGIIQLQQDIPESLGFPTTTGSHKLFVVNS